jgi:hypothetical protein
VTGARVQASTKIVVVDLDGEDAQIKWRHLCRQYSWSPDLHWICETGGGGRHLYFRIPEDVGEFPSRLLWAVQESPNSERLVKHKEIRILGDGALAIAPPSTHVETGLHYRWSGRYRPEVVALPDYLPNWITQLPTFKPVVKFRPPCNEKFTTFFSGLLTSDRDSVIIGVSPTEKVRLARQWGLRFSMKSNPAQQWMVCHAIDRDDRHPSATFCPTTGVYMDHGRGTVLSFLDLAVELGAFPSWQDCLDSLRSD